MLAWVSRTSLAGEAAAALLSALSCVTLGVLLAAVTPPSWLKVGIVLMAAADTWLVVSDLLQSPERDARRRAPGGGLPQLQSEIFGTVSMGYGDLFVAALLGAVLAVERRLQRAAALLTFVLAALFDLLFFVVNELPATVPVALAVICSRSGGEGRSRSAAGPARSAKAVRRWRRRLPREGRRSTSCGPVAVTSRSELRQVRCASTKAASRR